MTLSKSERNIYEPKMSEEQILGQIVSMLELNGARVHRIVERIPWGRKTSTPGVPDLYGYFPNRIPVNPDYPSIEKVALNFWIEVKRPGAHRRPAQVAWIEQAQRDGVIAFFAESWLDVVRYFEEHGIVLKIK